jgi:hypothetical protein
MDDAFTRCEADLIKILAAVNAGGIGIAFYLKYVKTLQL